MRHTALPLDPTARRDGAERAGQGDAPAPPAPPPGPPPDSTPPRAYVVPDVREVALPPMDLGSDATW